EMVTTMPVNRELVEAVVAVTVPEAPESEVMLNDVEPQPPAPEAFLTVQLASTAQHAPVGIVHGFGEQELPTTPNVLGWAHALGTVSVQTPAVEQHGPAVAVHGLGEQVEPKPWKILAPE